MRVDAGPGWASSLAGDGASLAAAEAEEDTGVLGLVDVALEVEAGHLEEGQRRHEAVAPGLVRSAHTLNLHHAQKKTPSLSTLRHPTRNAHHQIKTRQDFRR